MFLGRTARLMSLKVKSCTKFLLFQNIENLSARGTYRVRNTGGARKKEQEKHFDRLQELLGKEGRGVFLKQEPVY